MYIENVAHDSSIIHLAQKYVYVCPFPNRIIGIVELSLNKSSI